MAAENRRKYNVNAVNVKTQVANVLATIGNIEMPLPSPQNNQNKQSFVSSCMDDEEMKKEFPNQKQRAAVCYSKYKQSKKSKGSDSISWEDLSNEDYILYL